MLGMDIYIGMIATNLIYDLRYAIFDIRSYHIRKVFITILSTVVIP